MPFDFFAIVENSAAVTGLSLASLSIGLMSLCFQRRSKGPPWWGELPIYLMLILLTSANILLVINPSGDILQIIANVSDLLLLVIAIHTKFR